MKRILKATLIAFVGGAAILLLMLGINASVFGPDFPPMIITRAVATHMACGVIFSALVDLALKRIERPTTGSARSRAAYDSDQSLASHDQSAGRTGNMRRSTSLS